MDQFGQTAFTASGDALRALLPCAPEVESKTPRVEWLFQIVRFIRVLAAEMQPHSQS